MKIRCENQEYNNANVVDVIVDILKNKRNLSKAKLMDISISLLETTQGRGYSVCATVMDLLNSLYSYKEAESVIALYLLFGKYKGRTIGDKGIGILLDFSNERNKIDEIKVAMEMLIDWTI